MPMRRLTKLINDDLVAPAQPPLGLWGDPSREILEIQEVIPTAKKKRKSPNGAPTNDLVLSSYIGGNDEVFPYVASLYIARGSKVADVTYGKGVFWRNIPKDYCQLMPSDLQDGIDCRNLPYASGSIDCVVFDPPYMHTPGGTAHNAAHSPFEKHYRNNGSGNQTESKYHEAVLDLYRGGGLEAYRTLKENGVFIVKCQDEVCANRQRFTHIELIQMYEKMGFVAEDLFVIMRSNRPGVSRMICQVHARKNHSYFLVFWKRGKGKRRWNPNK